MALDDLTDYEQEMFDALVEAEELNLIEAELDGQRVGVVTIDVDDGDPDALTVQTLPVAILLSEDMFRRLTPPQSHVVVDDSDAPGMSSSDTPN